MRLGNRRGFALMAALMVTLLVAVLALTAGSLALLARRTSASALALARADALAEADPAPLVLPVPPSPGLRLALAGPAAVPGWSTTWEVTRLGGDLLLVRAESQLSGPAGDLLARATLFRLFRTGDSIPLTPLPGGWLGAP